MKFTFYGTLDEWERFISIAHLMAATQGPVSADREKAPSEGPSSTFRDRLRDGSSGPEMVWLPAGTFLMGSPTADDLAYGDEHPQHDVRIGRPFAIGRFPVTLGEYDAYCQAVGATVKPNRGWGGMRQPVTSVSWQEANAYCIWLSEQTGRSYRLPSEAEWEYACRAGTRTRWPSGNEEEALGEYAWYDGNSGGKTHPVGEKKPNPWGLYDMHGNIWEWVQDHWHSDYRGAPDDGSPWVASAVCHVLRGGSADDIGRILRSAVRMPAGEREKLGFRIALSP